MHIRTGVLWLALLVTIGFTWHTIQYEADDNHVFDSNETILQTNPAERHVDMTNEVALKLRTRVLIKSVNNLFDVSRNKYVPIDISDHTQMPADRLPLLPFKYIGRWQDASRKLVMLEHDGDVLTLQEGDVVGDYQFSQIDETLDTIVVEFLYRPLNEKQSLTVGIKPNE